MNKKHVVCSVSALETFYAQQHTRLHEARIGDGYAIVKRPASATPRAGWIVITPPMAAFRADEICAYYPVRMVYSAPVHRKRRHGGQLR